MAAVRQIYNPELTIGWGLRGTLIWAWKLKASGSAFPYINVC
jgi:hypothetical protein